jgi:hypothetical protein
MGGCERGRGVVEAGRRGECVSQGKEKEVGGTLVVAWVVSGWEWDPGSDLRGHHLGQREAGRLEWSEAREWHGAGPEDGRRRSMEAQL